MLTVKERSETDFDVMQWLDRETAVVVSTHSTRKDANNALLNFAKNPKKLKSAQLNKLIALKTSLEWALNHIEYPLVVDPLNPERSYKGCPGCRIVWTRDIEHKPGCQYIVALEAIR